MNDLIIIGASGHGKVIAEIAEINGYSNIIFLDDNPEIKFCGNYRVIGGCIEANKHKDSDFIVAIGNATIRARIQTELASAGVRFVSIVHPDAVISKSADIGEGTVVMAGAVINADVKIGQGCIINTCASVDHDCDVGDFVHVSVGAHVAGTVKIGDNTWIGAGAVVSNNINITSDCMIGAGAVVVNDLIEPATYIGVPARKKNL